MGASGPGVGSSILSPASVLSSWPAPNFTDPVTRSKAGPIICTLIAGLTVVCVALRLWTRAFALRNVGLDDWLIAWAVIPLIGLTVAIMLLVERYQFNRHAWDVEPENYEPAYKLAWLLQLFYCFCVNPAKISVLLFYQRLTTHTVNRIFLLVVRATIAFIFLHMIAFLFFFFLLLECHPLNTYWSRYSVSNLLVAAYAPATIKVTCVNEGIAVFGMSVPQVLTDLLTTLLPNLLLLHLSIPRSQKVKLAFLFGASYIVTIVGAMRVAWTWKYLFVSWDRTWTGHTLLIWSELEACFAVLCSCAPALNALHTKWVGPKVKEMASSVRTKRSRRKTQSVRYAEMGVKAPPSETTTATTVTTIRDSVVRPQDRKGIEMVDVNVYSIGKAR